MVNLIEAEVVNQENLIPDESNAGRGNVSSAVMHEETEVFFLDLSADFDDLTEAPLLSERDCELMFETVIKMYEQEKVKFSNAAEKFLQRTREIQSSAEFAGLMDQAYLIEARMHMMCGEDHALQQAMQRHNHPDGSEHHDDEEDDKKKNNNKRSLARRSREKVIKVSESLWSIIFDNMSSKKLMKGNV